MLQEEHSAILLTFIKLPFVIKISVSSIFSAHLSQVLLYCEFKKITLMAYCLSPKVQKEIHVIYTFLDLNANQKHFSTRQWFCYLHILHLLRIILSPGCKVFISASPRIQ